MRKEMSRCDSDIGILVFLDVCQAKKLMDLLEEVSEHDYNAFFVDLFVRCGKWGVVNSADCFARNVC